jgi:hypothetical protein
MTTDIRAQRQLAFTLLGKHVRFAHMPADVAGSLVLFVTDTGMVVLEGWTGEFAPSLFVVVPRADV